MPDPIKIRAQQQGELTEIRILMPHPMENGLRKDDSGQLSPAHYIQSFTVNLNGQPFLAAQTNTSLAKNPLFVFKSRQLKTGDRITVAWEDNKGEKSQDEISVA